MSVNFTGMQTVSMMMGSMDYSQIIQQLYQVSKAPGDALNQVIQNEQLKSNDWGNISKLAVAVQNDLLSFDKNSSVYSAYTTSITGTNSAGLTATAGTGAVPGTYNINVVSLGSAATLTSSAQIGAPVTLTTQVSNLDFSQPISTGIVSITIGTNTYTHTVASTDTIDNILSDLKTKSGNVFTYGIAGNQLSITNNSGSTISFGSAGDASNFFQVAGLTAKPASSGATVTGSWLGVAQLTQTLDYANFNITPYAPPFTPPSQPSSDTTGQAGDLKINGVDITYNTAQDTLQAVINRINASTAGVTASYDPLNDKVVLTSKTSQPISVQDYTGNVTVNGTTINAQAQLGKALNILSSGGSNQGTPTPGSQWVYSINGGPNQNSNSATVTSAIPGVSFTMNQPASGVTLPASATLAVATDTSALSKAVTNFVNDFNSLINQFRSYTGKGGDLEGDSTAAEAVYKYMTDVLNKQNVNYPLTSVMQIGITNGPVGSAPGTTNNLQVDSNALTTAYQNNPSEIQALLYGMATTLNADLTNMTGQFNDLTPITSSNQKMVGIAQSEQNMYAGMITSTENQQQQIYDMAAQQEQQMIQQFNQLQQYQQQMATQQNVIKGMLGTLAG